MISGGRELDDEEKASWSEPSAYWAAVSRDTRDQVRHISPAAARNLAPIIEALRPRLPVQGRVLEIGSGPGQHICAFATTFPHLMWLPSDPSSEARASIAAWTAEVHSENLEAPLNIDATQSRWWGTIDVPVAAMVVVNVLHIAPWAATEGILAGAEALLPAGGRLLCYGCFLRDGRHFSDRNIDFDSSLRHRNPQWGVRDIIDVEAAARRHGLRLVDAIDMPSNNCLLDFQK